MAFDLVIEVENTPGALADVAGAVSDAGVNLAAATCIGDGERAELKNQAVQDATLAVALEYANAVPGLDAKTLRWFLYSIEHRESTFSTTFCNYNDGAGSWNSPGTLTTASCPQHPWS